MLTFVLALMTVAIIAVAIFTGLLAVRLYQMNTELIRMHNLLLEFKVFFHTKELMLQIEREIPGIQLSCELPSAEDEPHRIRAKLGTQEVTVDIKWLGGFIRAWVENEDVMKAMQEASADDASRDLNYLRSALFNHMRRRLRFDPLSQNPPGKEKEN